MYVKIDNKQCGILIVEDDRAYQEILVDVLRDNGFSKIYSAENGIEALGLLATYGEEIYTIVLDFKMPKMGGIEMLKHLVNHHTIPVGVIASTVFSKTQTGQEFFNLSTDSVIAMNYLEKPYKINTLLNDIESTITAVSNKRDALNRGANENLHVKIDQLQNKIEHVAKHQPGFVTQLGLDVLRAIVIAIALLLLLLFGFGDFIKHILEKIE